MRDSHRMKEKFDVSLDNRQIVSLLIAGIVVMGAVFVLGVVVGKKLADNVQTASAPDLLSALDANAQALQQARATESPLTFQDELTRKAAPEPSKPASSKPATVTVAIPPPAPKPAPIEPPPSASSTDDDYAPPAAVARKPAEPKPAEQPRPVEPKVAESRPAPLPGKVESAPVPTRTAEREGGTLKEAIARATRQPTETVPDGAFTLQLSAFQDRQEADRFAARLRDRGYAPYIVTAEVPNKGTWYRVRMGSFPSREAATRYLTDFKRETRLEAFVAGAN